MRTRLAAAAAVLVVVSAAAARPDVPPLPQPARWQFAVSLDPKVEGPVGGRVLVAVGPKDGTPDFTDYKPPVLPVLGADGTLGRGRTAVLNDGSDVFPLGGLDRLPPGEYTVQAILATNPDVNLPDAPGNWYCEPVRAKLERVPGGTTVPLVLSKRFADEKPKDTATHRYLKLRSKLLSDFHGRPMEYRVGVVLPPGFDREPEKRYGLILDVGGFGTRYTAAKDTAPDRRFVQVTPDGAGPFGDPYQVNSANNGPYGDALVTELLPYLERTFRCGGPGKRFTCGASTGGWVSLALQLYYPDTFNGCWSQCPDSLTFERFELIDLYRDDNAFVNRFGFERPSTRTVDGDVVSTVRHEAQLDRVLGRGGRWELGGRDWASWNAVYGPRGRDGLPVPVWDGKSGAINKAVLDHWKRYDLMNYLTANWKALGPKLAGGKVNVWVGDADDYFLNAAVHRFKEEVGKLRNPPFDGRVQVELRKTHTSGGWTTKQRLDAMAARGGL
jgi:hypothetical protein